MRILTLRLKNLNSLAGEWRIDFTHSSFSADGLMVISGPTGAGKSTILDALCLALYGRTPRLKTVNSSENEIMSRRTGECLAEVTFAVPTGIFTCCWSQRRAYGKPDGKLQEPRQEIIDAQTGKPCETKPKKVQNRVEQLTGMDFVQFTRSMLLAQGDFENFLQARPDERAPLLEQITGTEIYGCISVQVHKRWTEEKKRRDTLIDKLNALDLLEEKEEQDLRAQQQKLDKDIREASDAEQELQEAVNWREGIKKKEDELKELKGTFEDWQVRHDAFAPDQARLNSALRALELESSFDTLRRLREEQKQDQSTLQEKETNLPCWENQWSEAAAAFEQAKRESAAARKERESVLPLCIKARQKDADIAEQEKIWDDEYQAIQDDSKRLTNLKKDKTDLSDQLNSVLESLKHCEDYEREHAGDASLVESFSSIKLKADELARLEAQSGKINKDLAKNEERRNKAKDSFCAAEQTWETAHAQQETAQKEWDAQARRLDSMLSGKSREDWQDTYERLKEEISSLSGLENSAKTMEDARAKQNDFQKKKRSLEKKDTIAKARSAELENQEKRLSDNVLRQERIRNLEEHRHNLRQGEPCPLCGSLEHPYVQRPFPFSDMETARADLENVRRESRELQRSIGKWKSDLDKLTNAIDEQKRLYDEAFSKLQEYDVALAKAPERCRILEGRRSVAENEARRARELIQNIDALDKALREKEKDLKDAEKRTAKAKDAKQISGFEKKSASEEFKRLQEDDKGLREQLSLKLADFTETVRPFGMEEGGNPLKIVEDLASRLSSWKDTQRQISDLKSQEQKLRQKQNDKELEYTSLQTELRAKKRSLAAMKNKLEGLRQERKELLGTKNPDKEEDRLGANLRKAESEQEKKERDKDKIEKEVENYKADISSLLETVSKSGETLRQKEAAFSGDLDRAGFESEAVFCAARLTRSERQELSRHSQDLDREKAGLDARNLELETNLKKEKDRDLTQESVAELKKKRQKWLSDLKELSEKSGAVREKLEANERAKSRRQDGKQKLKKQKEITDRWEALHELIGSSDGKKFRVFAQGLTFERVVAQANKALQRMSDRYLLKCSRSQPLELDVIDAYQGEEVRSTKNLSGGERFLVSLSLALGLSNMAGRSIQVDSLFLDEGFGTLDEEALETALDALMSLHREGKQICVISHIQALKERIPAQIQVEPIQDGRSRLIGPGCECVAEAAR